MHQAHLAHTGYTGNQKLAKELVFHRDLCEEVVNLIIVSVWTVASLSDHVCKHEAGLCMQNRGRKEKNKCSIC